MYSSPHPNKCLNRDADALDLVERLLQLDPERRDSSRNALRHPFITGRANGVGRAPEASELAPLPKEKGYHEWETKQMRKRARAEKAAAAAAAATGGGLGGSGAKPTMASAAVDVTSASQAAAAAAASLSRTGSFPGSARKRPALVSAASANKRRK